MFESEIGFLTGDRDELPEDVRRAMDETARLVTHRSTIPWAEHCSECAMPACFTSCEFYDPRPDMKCRRFRNGFVAIDTDGAAVDRVMKLTFRKWGKLEGLGTTALARTEDAVRLERRDIQLDRLLHSVPLPFGAKVYAMRARQRHKRAQVTGRGPAVHAVRPNCFILEAFNPGTQAVSAVLTMRPTGENAAMPYQRAVELAPGYTRTVIPIAEIADQVQLDSEFLVQFEPSGLSDDTTIYFGLVDFAAIDDPLLASSSASGVAKEPRPAQLKTPRDGENRSDNAADNVAAPLKHIKCVLWDLDNTLWHGILIEDGLEKLMLNQVAVDAIRELDRRGILNSAVSKNNHDDAVAALKHFGIEEYFLYPQISWGPKSAAISQIAKRLNIGTDTFLFVDDQPFERAEVEAEHPEVAAFDAAELTSLLENPRFDVAVTAESRARRSMYRQEMERETATHDAKGDYLGFLRTCSLKLSMLPLTLDAVPRVHELAQRTNQMNFSGTRYSVSSIESMLADDAIDAYVLRASDRFGDYGLIGFAVIDRQVPLLKDLMFSCRIQSKWVDRAFLCRALQIYAGSATRGVFEAVYNETDKNRPAAQLFWDMGFEKLSSNGKQHRLIYDAAVKGLPDQDIVHITMAA